MLKRSSVRLAGLSGLTALAWLAAQGYTSAGNGTGAKDSAALVRKYLEAPSWQERVAFVAEPERMRSLMEKRYGTGEQGKITDIRLAAPEAVTGLKNCYHVRASYTVVAGARRYSLRGDFFTRKGTAGWRVDWPASVGHNEISFAAYLATRPAEPTSFRVVAKLGAYYNFAYINSQKTHYNIRLRDNSVRPNFLEGYVARESADGKKLFELLKDGEEHHLTLAVLMVGPDGAAIGAGAGDRVVAITHIVKESWAPNK